MSLVTATAFQQSPAVQTRAFVAISALAISDVDDDFLYQILVAFKVALSKANESNTWTIVSMLRCMCKILPAIVDSGRYTSVMFWLAVALLQSSHIGFFVEAAWLLRVSLENMEERGMFQQHSVEDTLLMAREPLDEITSQLDELLKIDFRTNFSIALASIIFKGMRHTQLKDSAVAVLRSLLRVTSTPHIGGANGHANGVVPTPFKEIVGYFLGLIVVSGTPKSYRRLLKDAHLPDVWIAESGLSDDDEEDTGIPHIPIDILNIEDSGMALLIASLTGTMLLTAQGDDAETQVLYSLLSTLADSHPDIIVITYVVFCVLHRVSELNFISIATRHCRIAFGTPLQCHQTPALSSRSQISSA